MLIELLLNTRGSWNPSDFARVIKSSIHNAPPMHSPHNTCKFALLWISWTLNMQFTLHDKSGLAKSLATVIEAFELRRILHVCKICIFLTSDAVVNRWISYESAHKTFGPRNLSGNEFEKKNAPLSLNYTLDCHSKNVCLVDPAAWRCDFGLGIFCRHECTKKQLSSFSIYAKSWVVLRLWIGEKALTEILNEVAWLPYYFVHPLTAECHNTHHWSKTLLPFSALCKLH